VLWNGRDIGRGGDGVRVLHSGGGLFGKKRMWSGVL